MSVRRKIDSILEPLQTPLPRYAPLAGQKAIMGMGDKIESKKIAKDAGVNCIPVRVGVGHGIVDGGDDMVEGGSCVLVSMRWALDRLVEGGNGDGGGWE